MCVREREREEEVGGEVIDLRASLNCSCCCPRRCRCFKVTDDQQTIGNSNWGEAGSGSTLSKTNKQTTDHRNQPITSNSQILLSRSKRNQV